MVREAAAGEADDDEAAGADEVAVVGGGKGGLEGCTASMYAPVEVAGSTTTSKLHLAAWGGASRRKANVVPSLEYRLWTVLAQGSVDARLKTEPRGRHSCWPPSGGDSSMDLDTAGVHVFLRCGAAVDAIREMITAGAVPVAKVGSEGRGRNTKGTSG